MSGLKTVVSPNVRTPNVRTPNVVSQKVRLPHNKVYFNGIPGTFGEMYSSRWLPGDVPWKPQGWALMEPTMVFNCKCLGRNEAGPPSVIRTNGQGILPSYCHAQEEDPSFCKILISDDSTVVMICLEPLGPEVSLRPHSFKRVKNFDTCD